MNVSQNIYAVFSFAHLEDTEFLSTCTQHDQTFDFIMDFIGIIWWFTFLPIWSQSGNKFLPIDETFTIAIE